MVLAAPALLASPGTWIAAAVVLAVLALVVLALAVGRRRALARSTARAGGSPAVAAPADLPPPGEPVREADPITEPFATTSTEEHAVEEAVVAAPVSVAGPDGPTAAAASVTPAVDVKDRLLAALLPDPGAAVRALSALGQDGPDGAAATALLTAGLTPAQVARLCGVDEATLARRMATDLGLLPGAQGPATATGRNRTDVPGRAWANAGSAAGSTTPTTG